MSYYSENRVQVVSRQKLNCNRENIEVYRVKYDIFSIRIEFLTTNDLDPAWLNQATRDAAAARILSLSSDTVEASIAGDFVHVQNQ